MESRCVKPMSTESVDKPSDAWKIDHYQFTHLLGKGSFSKVYRAMSKKDGKEYAIKVVNDERIAEEHKAQLGEPGASTLFATLEDMLLSITDEAAVLSKLNHPNILTFHGVSAKGVYTKKNGSKQINTSYSISEVCPNGDLWEYIEYSGRFSEPCCRTLFKQMIEALEYMHTNGFAHRDIKPANMLLDANFNVKLNDFGFATSIRGHNDNGKLGTILGTPEYEAPEFH